MMPFFKKLINRLIALYLFIIYGYVYILVVNYIVYFFKL